MLAYTNPVAKYTEKNSMRVSTMLKLDGFSIWDEALLLGHENL